MSDTKSGTHAPGSRPRGKSDASAEPANSPAAGTASPEPIAPNPDASSRESPDYPVFDEWQDTVISQKPPVPTGDEPRPYSPIEMGAALQGQQLGHFQLEQFVGGGGMGAVFRARDLSLDRTVAVKVLSRDHADPDIHRRFRNEAQSAARLDHDNISRVFYVGQDKGWNYIVFEFVDGINIRDLVAKKGPLPIAEAISYTLQVAEALEHAHRRDVVHRDIKPSNLLITASGHVKLVDMGLARLHQVETPESDLTASGVTLGTFDYISPEQARDPRIADVRSDLYSLGCTFYFMLTGRAPFPEGTVLQKLLSHTSDERPDPRLYRPDLPEEVAEILNKLLARRPEQRYQQPNEVIGELLLVSDHLGLPNAGHAGRVWVTRSTKQPSWLERVTPVVLPLFLLLAAVWGLEKFFGRNEEASVDGRERYLGQDTSRESVVEKSRKTDELPAVSPPSEQNQPTKKSSATRETVEKEKTANESTLAGMDTRQPPDESGDPVEPKSHVGKSNGIGEVVASVFQNFAGVESAAEVASPPFEASLSEQTSVEAQLDGADVFREQVERCPEPAPAEIRRLIVAEYAPTESAIGSSYYPSFAQAVKSLDKFPNVETIELRFDGPKQLQPFQIKTADLTIQAGEGYQPVLRFEPGATELAAGGQMIQQMGGNLTLSGVQIDMTLPAEASSGGWTLFELHQVSSINLRDSSMTIRNAYDDGSSIHPGVAFFRVSMPPSQKMMAMPGEVLPMPMTPVIDLRRCIARGEATLIRMPEVTPVRLNWNQGLLAINERLIEAHGVNKVRDRDRPIEIDLIHLTAAIPQGMCRLVGEPDAQDQRRLDIECTACIFLCSSGVPIIEHDGVRNVADVRAAWLNYRGDNFYPTIDGDHEIVCWRIVPLAQPENAVTLTFEDRDERWWNGAIQSRVMWRKTPVSEPIYHRHLPQDYRLVEELRNPPIQSADKHDNAGFDIESLPAIFTGPAVNESAESTNVDAAAGVDQE